MRLALIALLLVIDLGPEGMPRGFRRPLHERLAQERRALKAPVHPGFRPTTFRDRCDTGILLEFGGRGVAFPLCAKRHQESGGKDGPGAWQGRKQGEVRVCLGALRHGVVEVFDGLQRHAELADKGWDPQRRGGHDARIRGQGDGALAGLETGSDDVGSADVVGLEESFEGGTARALCGFEGRPAAEEVAKDRGIFLLQPLQRLRKRVFEGTGQTVGQTDLVADQTPTVFDKLRQGAHGGTVGGECRELVAVCEEQFDLECGIGGVICGPARGKCFAVLGHGERMDGKEDEEVIWHSADTIGPLLSSRHTATGWPLKRVCRLWTHASIASGRCARRRNSLRVVPAACKQISCLASAQSRPTKAANASGACGCMCHLPVCDTVGRRDRPACVLRRHEREPVVRQTLRMRC